MSVGAVWRLLRYPFILLSLAIVPRLMGETDYGAYAYFVSLFVMLNAATDFGYLQVFGRFIPEAETSGNHAYAAGLTRGLLLFGLALAGGLALVLVLSYWIHPWGHLPSGGILALAVALILTRVEGTLFNLLYGMNHIARFSAKEALRSACTLVLVVTLYEGFGLKGAFWGLVLNELLLSFLGWHWTRVWFGVKTCPLPWSVLRTYVVFGLGFFFPALLMHVLQRAGNLFTKWWGGGPEQVAHYDIANQFLLLASMFIGLVLQTLLPSLTKLKVTDQVDTMVRWERVVMTYCFVLAFLGVNALVWLGEPLVLFWLGDSYAPAVQHAKVVALAIWPTLIAYAGMNYALLDKSARVYTAAVGAAAVVMTVLSAWWAPRHGASGVAWATVAAYWMMGGVFLLAHREQFGRILGPASGAALAALIMALSYRINVDGLYGAIVMFMVTSSGYVLLLFACRFLSMNDVRKIIVAMRGKAQGAK